MDCLAKIMLAILCLATGWENFAWAKQLDIIPEPQFVAMQNAGPEINISKRWKILVDTKSPVPKQYPKGENPYMFSAKELQTKIQGILKFRLQIEPLGTSTPTVNAIVLGNPLHNPLFKSFCRRRGVDIAKLPYKKKDVRYGEGYILKADKKATGASVIIAGRGPAGIYYGVKTFISLIGRKGRINALEIVDFPDMRWRGAHLVPRTLLTNKGKLSSNCLNSKLTDEILRKVEKLASYKMNVIVFDSILFHGLNKGDNRKEIERLFRECRRRFITPIPVIKSRTNRYNYKSSINNCRPLFQPMEQEGVWIRNEPFVFDSSNKAKPVNSQLFAIKNGSFETITKGAVAFWNLSGGWRRIDRRYPAGKEAAVREGAFAVKLKPSGKMGTRFETLVPHDGSGQSLRVVANSYYELTFWARAQVKSQSPLFLSVYQLDRRGRKIQQGATFPHVFKLNPKWGNFHRVLFTHPECKRLKLEFKVQPRRQPGGEIFFDDVRLVRMNGLFLNVLRGPLREFKVVSPDMHKVYREKIDYVFEPGPFAFGPPFLPQLMQGKLYRTKNSAIPVKGKVLISYDCTILNPKGEQARRCLSHPGVFKQYRRLLEDITVLNPKYIHIDMDEYRGGLNRDSLCLKRGVSNAALIADFVNGLNKILHTSGQIEVLDGVLLEGLGRPDVRLIMWDDMVNYWHNGGGQKKHYFNVSYGGLQGSGYLALPETPLPQDKINRKGQKSHMPISKDVIMGSWWYHTDKHGKIKNTPRFYETRGIDYYVSPWYRMENVKDWAVAVEKSNALGMIGVAWGGKANGLRFIADYAWKGIHKRP